MLFSLVITQNASQPRSASFITYSGRIMNLICSLQFFDMDIGGLQQIRHKFLFSIS